MRSTQGTLLRQVGGTLTTRIVVVACNMGIIVLAGHRLGLEGLGTIGLVILGIGLFAFVANLLGGAVNVYLVPRQPMAVLLRAGHGWALASMLVAGLASPWIPGIPSGFGYHMAALACLQAMCAVHCGILIGRLRIDLVNRIQVLQGLVHIGLFAWLLRAPDASPVAYVHAFYVSTLLGVILSAWALYRLPTLLIVAEQAALPLLFRQGLAIQGSNIVQLLNYRLLYWVIDAQLGRALLGLYTVGTQLAEAAWLAPKSLGSVLYGQMSNAATRIEQRWLTLLVLKTSIAAAAAVLLVMLCLPDSLFAWVFGPEVRGIRPLLLLLAPGILAVSASQALSHFFSGTGRNKHNLLAALIGLLCVAGVGYPAVAHGGLQGAALTTALGYLASLFYQLIVFRRTTASKWSDLLPAPSDLRYLQERLRARRRA